MSLTRAQILECDDAPADVKAAEGKKGRRRKWRSSDFAPEDRAAIAVELERIRYGVKARRTPSQIYDRVADELAMSARSVRRFHSRHRDFGRYIARTIAIALEKRKRKR